MNTFLKTISDAASPTALKYIGLLAPALLACAIGATLLVVRQGLDLAKPTPIPDISVRQEYLAGAALDKAIERMKRENPGVEVLQSAGGGAVTVRGKDITAYNDFILSLSATPALEQGVFWKSTFICLNDCPDKSAVMAEIKGFRQSIVGK